VTNEMQHLQKSY